MNEDPASVNLALSRLTPVGEIDLTRPLQSDGVMVAQEFLVLSVGVRIPARMPTF